MVVNVYCGFVRAINFKPHRKVVVCGTHTNGMITAYFQGNLNLPRKCALGFKLLEKSVKPDPVVNWFYTAVQRLVPHISINKVSDSDIEFIPFALLVQDECQQIGSNSMLGHLSRKRQES